jgi:cation diffusion facilitator family transporter
MKVAALSVASNTGLILIKIVAGILSGSISIISEAIHSGMDLIASIIAFFSVRMSSKPADKLHPYGHGKIENVSGVIEGILIFIAAVLIINEAITKILHPTEIHETYIAIGVMIVSAIVNSIVSSRLYKVAKESESVALEADALHLKTDVYTALGVGVGLLLITLTGIKILDPIAAIIVALFIVKEAWELIREAFSPLLDVKLSDEEEASILKVMDKYKDQFIDYHALRTRKAGNIKYVDFHMNVRGDITVAESHSLTEKIECDIERVLTNTNINIHIEPAESRSDNP